MTTTKMTKTDFILKHPNASAADVVSKANRMGIRGLKLAYVYKVRSKARKTSKPTRPSSRSTTLNEALTKAVERFASELRSLTLREVAQRLTNG